MKVPINLIPTRHIGRCTKKDISRPPIGLPFKQIPGPRSLPLVGNVWRYLPLVGQYKPDKLLENAQLNRRKYGPIVREHIYGNLTVLHLFDPADIESLFRQQGKFPHRRSHRALLKYRLDRPELYNDGGLFPENGASWFRQRSQFHGRMLSKIQVQQNVSKLDKCNSIILDKISETSHHDGHLVISNFETHLNRWALSSSLCLLLDVSLNEYDDSFINKLIKAIDNSLLSTARTEIESDKWIEQPDKCPHFKMLANTQEILHKFVAQHVKHRLENPLPLSTISYLNTWLHEDKLGVKDVISFVIDSLMAGLHTTSYTTAFMLYHLSKHPEIQSNIRRQSFISLSDGMSIEPDAIDGLSILRNCLKETMRLNPVSIGTGRLTHTEMQIGGYNVERGIQIITQNEYVGRDNQIYDDANTFKPERWDSYRSRQRSKQPSPFASLPFGYGSRSCIGKRVAEIQIQLLVARFLQRFKLLSMSPIPVKTTLINHINGPIEVDLIKAKGDQ